MGKGKSNNQRTALELNGLKAKGLEIEEKLIKDLDSTEVERLFELTLPSGSMGSRLHRTLRAGSPRTRNQLALKHYNRDYIVMVRKAGKIQGWAMVQCAKEWRPPTVYLFVAPRHRRKGLGRRLMSQILAKHPKANVCPWDLRSYRFFKPYLKEGQADCSGLYRKRVKEMTAKEVEQTRR